jgi:hypothetical protein
MRLLRRDQLRYRLMMDLFGLRLDKRAFAAANGVPSNAGCLEYALPQGRRRVRRATTPRRIELTETGRYLLVVMMREFFIGVNGIRDLARAQAPRGRARAVRRARPAAGPCGCRSRCSPATDPRTSRP